MNTHRTVLAALKVNLTPQMKFPVLVNGFTRDHLIDLYKTLGFTTGVEVGTAKGIYALSMCITIPTLHLFCVDPWLEYDQHTVPQDRLDAQYEATKKKLSPYNCTIVRKTSMDAVKDFKNNSLDFVYVDGNHFFEATINDLYEWSKKVRPGGIIAGHDYEHYRWEHSRHWRVVEAVDAYTHAHGIRPWFVFGRDPKTFHYRDCPRSYMWIKE